MFLYQNNENYELTKKYKFYNSNYINRLSNIDK